MYTQRIVDCGAVREVKRFFSSRVHTKGIERSGNVNETSQAQEKCNERRCEDRLRWTINANYREGDYHLVLHFRKKGLTPEKILDVKAKFLRRLSAVCKKKDIILRWLCVIETKRWTNPHLHFLVNQEVEERQIVKCWTAAAKEYSGITSVTYLDDRKNHAKLANYLMKEGKSWTGKRYTKSRTVVTPEPEYQKISSRSWAKTPRPKKGYYLWKDENGEIMRTGVHEVTGWQWAEYAMIRQEESICRSKRDRRR